MKYLQLGNGGGFDFDKTSSSFLVTNKPDNYLLIDCGFNVLSELKRLSFEHDTDYITKTSAVFITHLHEDHISNLMSLIFYRYYMCGGAHTKIYVGNKTIANSLESYLAPCNSTYRSGLVSDTEPFSIYVVDDTWNLSYLQMSIDTIPATHPGIESYGIVITENTVLKSKLLAITGDTKAYHRIELKLEQLLEHIPTNGTCILHDFSSWDNVSQNVHACQSDIETEYSPEFRSRLTYYHNNAPFKQEWVTL